MAWGQVEPSPGRCAANPEQTCGRCHEGGCPVCDVDIKGDLTDPQLKLVDANGLSFNLESSVSDFLFQGIVENSDN